MLGMHLHLKKSAFCRRRGKHAQVIMKKLLFFLAASLAVAACSNDDEMATSDYKKTDANTANIEAGSLADIQVYANKALLSSTLSGAETVTHFVYSKVQDHENVTGEQLKMQLDAIDPIYYTVWTLHPEKTDRNESVSTDEYNYVIKYMQEHKDEGFTDIDIDTYYIQYVGGGNHRYDAGKDHNGAQHYVDNGSAHIDYIYFGDIHVNDYNANYGPRAFVNGCNLKDNEPSYHESWGDKDQQKYNHYQYYYITYNGQKNLYLGFDYTTEKNSGEKVEGDGIYDDYVIKIVAASEDKSHPSPAPAPTPTPTPEPTPTPTPEPSPTPTPEPTPTPTPDPTPAPTPDDPSTDAKPNVEVDFNVKHDNETYGRNETKLSIHVRDTVDVEVFIPIAKEYYCEKDDMLIVERHEAGYYVHNGQIDPETGKAYSSETLSMNIAGDDITLTISYEADGIRVKTKGIGANALKYCREQFGDGITFEISNYFTGFNNAAELLEKLKSGKPWAKFYTTDGTLISGYQYYDDKALYDDDNDIIVKQAD